MRRPVSVLIALVVMATMLAALTAPALANHLDDFDEDCFVFDGRVICDDDDFFFDDDDVIFRGVGDGGDLEIEDSGASIELSPTQTTTGDQQVNQAASAFGS